MVTEEFTAHINSQAQEYSIKHYDYVIETAMEYKDN